MQDPPVGRHPHTVHGAESAVGAERYLPLEVIFVKTNRAAHAQIDHEAAGRIVFSG